MDKINILMASPEAVPFVKTGGLADVAGALPQALAALGHSVKVIIPLYRSVKKGNNRISKLEEFPNNIHIKVAEKEYLLSVYSASEDETGVQYLFVHNDELFDRDGLYIDPETGEDYPDNDERFLFYSRAVLEIAKGLEFKPDIIHLHDWQAAMVAGYLVTSYKDDPVFQDSKTIFTIHNIGYQGHFEAETFPKLGLDEKFYTPGSPFEYWDHVNFMKIGITTTDLITTVSETYADEICADNDSGFGMEGILTERKDDLFGVLNGVDYDIWSPEKDELIPYNYSSDALANKKKNREALLRYSGLIENGKRIPIIGVISRLADQKGFDLIQKIADKLFALDIKFILLGTGNQNYHTLFEAMEGIYAHKVKAFLEFDNKVAHLIEAGADMFLMPSRYEPCGLNQMYSLKYGTVPIVRETGGLADTIIDFTKHPNTGNGFTFKEYKPEKLLHAIKRAVLAYQDVDTWPKIRARGMAADFSWKSSAEKYVDIYKKAIQKKSRPDLILSQV
jgi:starch synthase